MKHFLKFVLNILIHICLYAIIYIIVSQIINKPAFPPLLSIIHTAFKDNSFIVFLLQIPITLLRWIIIFISGTLCGVIIGIFIGYLPSLHSFFRIDIDLFRSLPATALIVFFMAAFGDNEVSRNFPSFYIVFFTILFYVTKHTAILRHPRINHLKELGASKMYILKNCIIFELLPPLFIAIRQSVSLSFLVLISVELIIGSSGNTGIGSLLYDWMFYTEYTKIIIGLIILGIIGYGLNIIASWLNRKIIYWQVIN